MNNIIFEMSKIDYISKIDVGKCEANHKKKKWKLLKKRYSSIINDEFGLPISITVEIKNKTIHVYKGG